jgi:Toxin co-regulated pilus biosynthesis protein Q
MIRQTLIVLIASGLALPSAIAQVPNSGGGRTAASGTSTASPAWPVRTSLKATLGAWAQRQGWPAPEFLTDADWPVDVPGTIPGSFEDALRILTQGFGRAATRPRIALSANHVIVVSELGAE